MQTLISSGGVCEFFCTGLSVAVLSHNLEPIQSAWTESIHYKHEHCVGGCKVGIDDGILLSNQVTIRVIICEISVLDIVGIWGELNTRYYPLDYGKVNTSSIDCWKHRSSRVGWACRIGNSKCLW